MPRDYTPDGERTRLGRRERLTRDGGPVDTDTETCELCGEPRPPDGTGARIDGEWLPLCPPCEDQYHAAITFDVPPGASPLDRYPPHGNTTR